MDISKIKELMTDEAFVKELLETEEVADVQSKLASRGVELTEEEIKKLGQEIAKAADGAYTIEQLEAMANGELSDDELEDVAGGIITVATGLLILAATVIGIGGTGGAVYGAIKSRW